MSENKEINDILGQLRASVDKSDEAAGKTKKDKNDKFDREIAAMIEKQLNSRETAAATEKPAETSPLLSDEIDLSEFVTEEEMQAEQSETVAEEPFEEIVEAIAEDEPVEEELTEDEVVVEIVENKLDEDGEAATAEGEPIEQTEPVEDEAVIEEDKIYQLIVAEYSGNTDRPYTPAELLIGRVNIKKGGKGLIALLRHWEKVLSIRAAGRASSKNADSPEAEDEAALLDEIKALIKNELEKGESI